MASTVRGFVRCALKQLEPKLVDVTEVTAGPRKGEWEIIFDPPLPGPSLRFTVPTKPTAEVVERHTSEAKRLWDNTVTVTLPLPGDEYELMED